MRYVIFNIVLFFSLLTIQSIAQCPANIGFENGDFTNWICYAGFVDANGNVNVSQTAPIQDRHTINKNSFPQALDPYGNFPVNCPNGSDYSIRLGNSGTGKQAERVSYEFTIPAGQNIYSIIYNYAVVFENPNHNSYEQPKFTTNVFDVAAGQYIACPSFNFIASGNLPGFQLSTLGKDVYYKTWSPVSIKLVGYAGKTIRLEFTTNDCTKGGHFGYAYLDVNENCSSPISGNVYCNGADGVTLTAPFGFKAYNWYDANFSTVLGTSNTLTIKPPPTAGTVYALELVPFDGYGCLDTVYTTIVQSPDAFDFQLQDSAVSCATFGADITQTKYTSGSTPGLFFSYFLDDKGLQYIPTPKNITKARIYYVKAENAAGCHDLKPIEVFINPIPNLSAATNNVTICRPAAFDITNPALINGADPSYKYSYWKDAAGSIPVIQPTKIDSSGIYYIIVNDLSGCTSNISITASINTPFNFTTNNQTACGFVNLTAASVVNTNAGNFTFTYFTDATTSNVVNNPALITTSGTYYIKGNGSNGCDVVQPISIVVNPNPVLNITNPAAVTFPKTVDITTTYLPSSGINYTYWKDTLATNVLINPIAVDSSLTYYIKAIDIIGCTTIKPVTVIINEPPIVPPNAFSPNGDGINDTWEIQYLNTRFANCTVDIFNRYGQVVYHSNGYATAWNGTFNNQKLPFGTYYYTIKIQKTGETVSGSVTLLP
jgi:gliding motility-associated-like protein